MAAGDNPWGQSWINQPSLMEAGMKPAGTTILSASAASVRRVTVAVMRALDNSRIRYRCGTIILAISG